MIPETFIIKIELGNDALAGRNTPLELARILRGVADRLEYGDGRAQTLLDINGNVVGIARFES